MMLSNADRQLGLEKIVVHGGRRHVVVDHACRNLTTHAIDSQ
jgi:hypothetical protein